MILAYKGWLLKQHVGSKVAGVVGCREVGKAMKFVSASEALERLVSEISVDIGGEIVDVQDAIGRYVYRDYVSKVDLPPFDRSAVDGVAARFSDIAGASESSPVLLKLVGRVDVDSSDVTSIGRSEAALVSTGAPIPSGADVVIPLEYCLVRDDLVYLYRTYSRYSNISFRGEDLRVGDTIVRKGTKLKPWHVATLAASGYDRIEVFRKPRIAVLNTGDEILKRLVPNTTYYLIAAYIKEMGGEVVYAKVIPDDIEEIAEALRNALRVSDVAIITGGTSVGSRDLAPDAVLRLESSREIFRGVRIRPGRTASAYVVNGKPVLLISGLPVAAYISLELLLTPILNKAFGSSLEVKPTISGKLVRRLSNEVGFRSFYRVIACQDRGEVMIVPLRLTGSGILSTLLKANAILEIPEDLEGYDEGSKVEVTLIGPLKECSSIPYLETGSSTE
ncbi:MAG: molybdopterin molybdotransferase MoeA [Sulfolobales archaeon]